MYNLPQQPQKSSILESKVVIAKYHLNQVRVRPDIIHPEAKFLPGSTPVQSNKLCSSKIQWWGRIGYMFQKGATEKKKGVIHLKQVQNLARQFYQNYIGE